MRQGVGQINMRMITTCILKREKYIGEDLSKSQRKSVKYCLEFFFTLLERHTAKIITSLFREIIQLSENIYL